MMTLDADADEHGDQRGIEQDVNACIDAHSAQPTKDSRPDAGIAPL